MYGNHMQHPAFNALGSGMYGQQTQQQQNPYGNFAAMGGMYGQQQQQQPYEGGQQQMDGNPFGPNFRKNMGLMNLSQQLMQPGHQFNMNDGLYAAMAMQGMPGLGGGGQ